MPSPCGCEYDAQSPLPKWVDLRCTQHAHLVDPDAQDPLQPPEPYQGVRALFDADIARISPEWAPRQDWQVSPTGQLSHHPVVHT